MLKPKANPQNQPNPAPNLSNVESIIKTVTTQVLQTIQSAHQHNDEPEELNNSNTQAQAQSRETDMSFDLSNM